MSPDGSATPIATSDTPELPALRDFAPTSTTTPTPTTSTTLDPVVPGVVPATTFRAVSAPPSIDRCALYPTDHFLNATNVDTLPVHPSSAAWLGSLGGSAAGLRFPTSKIWESARSGMPINVVDSRVIGFTSVMINPSASSMAYRGRYPIPPSPRVQGHPSAQWDKHLLMVDVADCMAYELIQYDPLLVALTGVHSALSGTRYPLDSVEWPGITTNSPNTPMIGQYVRLEEVLDGDVRHPVGFCTDSISTTHRWPARSSDGRVDSPSAMPMGAWIRLRADVDTSALGPGAGAVARALREHGAVLTDTCSHDFQLMAENSSQWNDTDLQTLRSLTAADFEVVDTRPMQADDVSFRIR